MLQQADLAADELAQRQVVLAVLNANVDPHAKVDTMPIGCHLHDPQKGRT